MKLLLSEKNIMGFLPLWRELAKVNESECRQCLLVAYYCRIMTSRLKTRTLFIQLILLLIFVITLYAAVT